MQEARRRDIPCIAHAGEVGPAEMVRMVRRELSYALSFCEQKPLLSFLFVCMFIDLFCLFVCLFFIHWGVGAGGGGGFQVSNMDVISRAHSSRCLIVRLV